jgi:hypothetical protein
VGIREVALADRGGRFVDLNGGNGFRPCALKRQREAADTVEQGDKSECHRTAPEVMPVHR